MESGPHRLEPSEQDIQEFVQELKERSTLLDTLDAITGFSSNSQEDKHHLGVVGYPCFEVGFSQCVILCGRSMRYLRSSKTYHWYLSNRVEWKKTCILTDGPYQILGHSNHAQPCTKG